MNIKQMIEDKIKDVETLQNEIFCLNRLLEDMQKKENAMKAAETNGDYRFCPHCGDMDLIERAAYNFLCKSCERFILFQVLDDKSNDVLKGHYVYRYHPSRSISA